MSHLQTRPLTAICHITSDCYMSDLQARPLTVKCHIFKQDIWLLYVIPPLTAICQTFKQELWLLNIASSSKTSDCYMSHFQARPLTAISHTTSDCYMSDLQARPLTAQTFKQELWLLHVSHLPARILIAVFFVYLSNTCGCCTSHSLQ